MKKLFVFVTILFLAACGNSGASSNLEDFDNSDLKEGLQEEAFQSELPTKLPFAVRGATFTPTPGDQRELRQTFQFDGVDGQFMDLRTNSGEVHFTGTDNDEQVKIGDHDGTIGETENGSLSLHWKDGDLTYHLMANGDEVTKEELIETAESFE
ncbi:DUF4367 domain-containing protein [Bacillus sp. SG-1]|uniref:DUF4367 domain-containing protein n=1 Tax=Bacillus sp. SG-1 TaxID=161544 RepID=UPI0002D8BC0D|nr:DUF4367 domain-containing protein [Bacillus sp. SG-1]